MFIKFLNFTCIFSRVNIDVCIILYKFLSYFSRFRHPWHRPQLAAVLRHRPIDYSTSPLETSSLRQPTARPACHKAACSVRHVGYTSPVGNLISAHNLHHHQYADYTQLYMAVRPSVNVTYTGISECACCGCLALVRWCHRDWTMPMHYCTARLPPTPTSTSCRWRRTHWPGWCVKHRVLSVPWSCEDNCTGYQSASE